MLTLGFQVADWIEAKLVHGPGDVQGEHIELDDELVAFLVRAYELDEDGRRVYRRAMFSRPKGRAKSEFAGMITCAELAGPVRCDGFDANGDPVGRPVRAPFIRCLATEETQAGNTYDNVMVMLQEGEIANELHFDVGMTRVYLKDGYGGEIRPSTASSAAKDGGKETFSVADETHLYVTPELKRMYAVVRRNLRKRKAAEGWMLETTTAYRPGELSIAEGNLEQWRRHGAERGVLVDHREAPKVENWDDDEEMLEALRDVYGPAAGWLDLDGILADVRDPEADPSDSARYWLNQITVGSDRFVEPERWKAAGEKEDLADGEEIALGFDGSRTDDSTALVACRMSDGKLFGVACWEKPEGPYRDWEVPAAEVDELVRHVFETYQVRRFYPDPPYWQEWVAKWQNELGEKIVRPFWTSRPGQMAAALEEMDTALRSDEPDRLRHDESEWLTRHALAAIKEKKPNGQILVRKETRDSPRKIDGFVAATLARAARRGAIENGWKPRPKVAAGGFGGGRRGR